MGNQSPKPTLPAAAIPTQTCQYQIPAIKMYDLEENVQKKTKTQTNQPIEYIVRQNAVTKTEKTEQRVEKVLKQSNQKIYWPENHKISIKLPDVKPPIKKQLIKKTKEIREMKENANGEQEIQELRNLETTKSQYTDTQILTNRGKTAPLIASKQNPILQFGKTKKCRVSRML